MDNAKLIKLIDSSPLKPQDKDHWKSLLPKLNEEQKNQLEHSISAKTEVVKVIGLIDEALAIIDKAESEAETPSPSSKKEPVPEKYKKIPSMKDTAKVEDISQDQLIKDREDTQKRLTEIREELKKLSEETHGSPPPSYQTG